MKKEVKYKSNHQTKNHIINSTLRQFNIAMGNGPLSYIIFLFKNAIVNSYVELPESNIHHIQFYPVDIPFYPTVI